MAIADKSEQRKISDLVKQILAAKKRTPEADTTALDREIDRLVYQLYDLTPEEIAFVEAFVNLRAIMYQQFAPNCTSSLHRKCASDLQPKCTTPSW